MCVNGWGCRCAYVDVVDRWPDLGASLRSIGNHVTFLSGAGDREEFVWTDGRADSSEDPWEGRNLTSLSGVGCFLIVCAVSPWVLPVDVYLALVLCVSSAV